MSVKTWKINGLMVMNNYLPDMVTMSNFSISGSEDGLTGQVSYAVNLLPPDHGNFTAFDQITEEMAIEWTKGALGVKRVAAMEKEVQDQIEAQKVLTPQSAPLPWVAVEASDAPAKAV